MTIHQLWAGPSHLDQQLGPLLVLMALVGYALVNWRCNLFWILQMIVEVKPSLLLARRVLPRRKVKTPQQQLSNKAVGTRFLWTPKRKNQSALFVEMTTWWIKWSQSAQGDTHFAWTASLGTLQSRCTLNVPTATLTFAPFTTMAFGDRLIADPDRSQNLKPPAPESHRYAWMTAT